MLKRSKSLFLQMDMHNNAARTTSCLVWGGGSISTIFVKANRNFDDFRQSRHRKNYELSRAWNTDAWIEVKRNSVEYSKCVFVRQGKANSTCKELQHCKRHLWERFSPRFWLWQKSFYPHEHRKTLFAFAKFAVT